MIYNMSNASMIDDPYSPTPLISCSSLYPFGIVGIVIFCGSISTNTTLLWLLIKYKKELLNSVNILIAALSVLSIIGSFFEIPMVTIAAFKCR